MTKETKLIKLRSYRVSEVNSNDIMGTVTVRYNIRTTRNR